jgi:CBS domain-containing membrane protein
MFSRLKVSATTWWLALWPMASPAVSAREQWRALLGAGAGIVMTALLARWLGTAMPVGGAAWIAAPLGASAVLVFAVPASPLAQPWAVVGGNALSALVGSLCAMFIPDPAWAGAVAVAGAIAVMFWARCLHPPGGASALLAALTGAKPEFALFPMLTDSMLLVMAGMLYNELTGRRYPHRGAAQPSANPSSRFSGADLDAALAHYNQVLDVSRDDLEGILGLAEAAAYERNFGHLLCADIMTKSPVTARLSTSLAEAWRLMRERRIKALPVVDQSQRVVGILTVADFMRHAGLDQHEGVAERLLTLVTRDAKSAPGTPDTVARIMTRGVRVISGDRRVAELVPLFSEAGHHHIPVIDADKQLVGIITQSDLVRALYRATRPAN